MALNSTVYRSQFPDMYYTDNCENNQKLLTEESIRIKSLYHIQPSGVLTLLMPLLNTHSQCPRK